MMEPPPPTVATVAGAPPVSPVRTPHTLPPPHSGHRRSAVAPVPALPLLAGFAAGSLHTVRRRAQGRTSPPQQTPKVTTIATEPGTAPGEPDTAAEPDGPAAAVAPAVCAAPLACPVCQRGFAETGPDGVTCRACRTSFAHEADGNFLDLTLTSALPSGAQRPQPKPKPEAGLLQRLPFVKTTDALAGALGLPQSREVEALGRELLRDPRQWLGRSSRSARGMFQNPAVSFAYERGWRRGFASSGFPGVDKELEIAQEWLPDGDVLLDASCGSGLFSRRFAKSGKYRQVIALDFSAAMLRQVDDFAVQELGADYDKQLGLVLVRADISRLPFETGSLGSIHAGAAIHCWPAPEVAMAEIARVLRPGGTFVFSTFRSGPFGDGQTNGFRFWEEEQLRLLTRQCGLVDFAAITREPAFIMVRVCKQQEYSS